MILKPLDQALKDKDEIYAVIKASAVNHVGKSSGMHVPSPVAQESVIRECLDKTGIDPKPLVIWRHMAQAQYLEILLK